MKKTPKMLEIEAKYNMPLEKLLKEEYEKLKNIAKVGEGIGIGHTAAGKWLKYCGIESKKKKPNKYWSLKNTLEEAKAIIKETGYLPPAKELKGMERYDILHAIDKHGGFHKIKKALNIESQKQPNGYWNLKNTLNESKKIVKKKRYLPSGDEMRELGRSDLDHAINDNGGYELIRKLLRAKEPPQWKKYSLEEIKEKCDLVLKAIGKENNPEKLSLTDFKKAKEKIGKDYSGICERYRTKGMTIADATSKMIKELYKVKSNIGYIIKPKEYWIPRKVDRAFDSLRKKLKRNPTAKEFVERYAGAIGAIIKRRYNKDISTWKGYLKHRGLYTEKSNLTAFLIDYAKSK